MDDPYANAVSHYTSTRRGDLVKDCWERPAFAHLIGRALHYVLDEQPGLSVCTVLDVGAGAAEGFDLAARAALGMASHPRLRYVALDRSAAMLRIAAARLRQPSADVRFVHADMEEFDFLSFPAQLYLSVGAPYSELTEAGLAMVLSRICGAVATSPDPAVAIIDVYGRYNLAWLPIASAKWVYAMSFFHDTPHPPKREMCFYVPLQLGKVLRASLPKELKPRLKRVSFVDRSIFTSRHTTTGAYHPGFPPLRTAVNELLSGSVEAVDRLIISPEAATALPTFGRLDEWTAKCLRQQVDAWNNAVNGACNRSASQLAASLRALNNATGRNATGIGHYLTMIAYFSSAGAPRSRL